MKRGYTEELSFVVPGLTYYDIRRTGAMYHRGSFSVKVFS